MIDTDRRTFLGGLAFAAGGLITSQAIGVGSDGHAAGYDVAAASDYLPLIPRRTGDPVVFMDVPGIGPPYQCEGITIMRFVGPRVI
jgi:oxalate decarboxylase